jgi:hypothetical protein
MQNCLEKLVAHTYDHASVMSGGTGGVQAIVKQICNCTYYSLLHPPTKFNNAASSWSNTGSMTVFFFKHK